MKSFVGSPRVTMNETTVSAADLGRMLADSLEATGFSYALGGALALAYYAPPRATLDVDINVFVPVRAGIAELLTVLSGVGFVADELPDALQRHAETDGQFRGRASGLRVDVFVPAIDYYAELEVRRRSVELAGRPVWILGPEDLVVLKMMFFRRKDMADVEAMLRDQGSRLDIDFVRDKLIELVGRDDARLEALRDIIRDVGVGP
jgi:hypothetical protein